MFLNLLQTEVDALAADAVAQLVPQQQEMSYSLIEMASKGGWLMIVLLILSVIALYIFGKKWWMIRGAGKLGNQFLMDIRDYIHEAKIKSALTLCQRYDSPIARIVEKGLHHIGRDEAEIRSAMETCANSEVARLEKGLPFLATIAGGAPMIGFLGTVLGMVQAFFNMANAGNNIDITLLAGGIYTAMITTVGGLIVGVLAYFGYNILNSMVASLVAKMENVTGEFIEFANAPAEDKTEE